MTDMNGGEALAVDAMASQDPEHPEHPRISLEDNVERIKHLVGALNIVDQTVVLPSGLRPVFGSLKNWGYRVEGVNGHLSTVITREIDSSERFTAPEVPSGVDVVEASRERIVFAVKRLTGAALSSILSTELVSKVPDLTLYKYFGIPIPGDVAAKYKEASDEYEREDDLFTPKQRVFLDEFSRCLTITSAAKNLLVPNQMVIDKVKKARAAYGADSVEDLTALAYLNYEIDLTHIDSGFIDELPEEDREFLSGYFSLDRETRERYRAMPKAMDFKGFWRELYSLADMAPSKRSNRVHAQLIAVKAGLIDLPDFEQMRQARPDRKQD